MKKKLTMKLMTLTISLFAAIMLITAQTNHIVLATEDEEIEKMAEKTQPYLDLYMPLLGQELNASGRADISVEASKYMDEVYLMGYTGSMSFQKSDDNTVVGSVKWTSNETMDDNDFNNLVDMLDYYYEVSHEEKTGGKFSWETSDESTWDVTAKLEDDKAIVIWDGVWDSNSINEEEQESASPQNEASKYGSVSGNVTYYYNDFQGSVADTGALVILVPKNGKGLFMPDDDMGTWLLDSLINECGNDYGVYAAKVDGTGSYAISHVPVGDYVIYIKSKNTNTQTAFNDRSTYRAGIENYFSSLLSQTNCEAISELNGYNKYTASDITIYSNETTTMSYDFGITYMAN